MTAFDSHAVWAAHKNFAVLVFFNPSLNWWLNICGLCQKIVEIDPNFDYLAYHGFWPKLNLYWHNKHNGLEHFPWIQISNTIFLLSLLAKIFVFMLKTIMVTLTGTLTLATTGANVTISEDASNFLFWGLEFLLAGGRISIKSSCLLHFLLFVELVSGRGSNCMGKFQACVENKRCGCNGRG